VQSELNIIANITDNQAIYRCEAQNSATDVPLLDSKTLSVHCELIFVKGNQIEN
jgi:nephron